MNQIEYITTTNHRNYPVGSIGITNIDKLIQGHQNKVNKRLRDLNDHYYERGDSDINYKLKSSPTIGRTHITQSPYIEGRIVYTITTEIQIDTYN